jgi:8-oxo-dGTP diphosphatase
MPADVLAAGGLVWRVVEGRNCIGIVRRIRYGGDVSFPKGKLDPGESLKECALREVAEELGVRARLGEFAGLMTYRVGERDKYVLFWEMHYESDAHDVPADVGEVLERLWLTPDDAMTVLSYRRDRELLHHVLGRRHDST